MAKPWEKYQSAKTGPWSKYQDKTGVVADFVDKLSPDQVQPEWISTGERMIAKNLAQSPQKQMEYLKQEHPDKEFAVNANQQVLVKDKGAGKWQVLDPDTGFFSDPAEFAKDAGDMLYDIPAGIAQGVATTAGAVGGTLVGGPGAGTMAGASAASGASGATLEALRQKLGNVLGIPQEVDGSQVAMSGAVGLAAPLMFGAGKASSGAVAKLAANLGIGEDAARAMIEKGSRGLVERGYDVATRKVAPSLLSAATGVDSDAIKYYGANPNRMQEIKAHGISETAQNLSDKVTGYVSKQKDVLGKDIQQMMEDAGQQVDISAAKASWKKKIADAEATAVTPADKSYVDAMKQQYQKYFGLETEVAPEQGAYDFVTGKFSKNTTELPDQIDATKAFDVQKKLKDAAKFDISADTAKKNAQTEGARSAYGDLNEAFVNATDGASKKAKDKYAKLIDLSEQIEPKFEDAQSAINTSTGLETKGRTVLKEKLQKLADSGDLDVTPELKQIRAYNEFYGPEKTSKPPLAAVLGSLGTLAGYNLNGGYAGAAVGGMAGAAAGSALGNRGLLEKLIKAGYGAEEAARLVQPSVGYGAVANSVPWMLLKPQEKQEPQP
jgi:hypothetical protein